MTIAEQIAELLRRADPNMLLADKVQELINAGVIIPGPMLFPQCICGHGIGLHDIRTNGTRGRCSYLAPPRGAQCICPSFEECAADD